MISLYARVEAFIRNKILSGHYEPGEKLPTLGELAAQFSVSKITIRTALSRLQTEGLITTMRGKGTFVSEKVPIPKQFIVSGRIFDIVLDAARYQVKAFATKSVRVGETRLPKDIRTFFKITNNEEIAWSRRIRLLKGIPIWFLENFLPLDIAQHLSTDDLSKKPLLKILKEKVGITVGRGEMYIEAVPAESEIADLLKCQTYDPLVHVQVYYWLSSGEPLETANAYLRAEYFKYKVDLDPKGFENI
jgi:GntR family transcriptional regulator